MQRPGDPDLSEEGKTPAKKQRFDEDDSITAIVRDGYDKVVRFALDHWPAVLVTADPVRSFATMITQTNANNLQALTIAHEKSLKIEKDKNRRRQLEVLQPAGFDAIGVQLTDRPLTEHILQIALILTGVEVSRRTTVPEILRVLSAYTGTFADQVHGVAYDFQKEWDRFRFQCRNGRDARDLTPSETWDDWSWVNLDNHPWFKNVPYVTREDIHRRFPFLSSAIVASWLSDNRILSNDLTEGYAADKVAVTAIARRLASEGTLRALVGRAQAVYGAAHKEHERVRAHLQSVSHQLEQLLTAHQTREVDDVLAAQARTTVEWFDSHAGNASKMWSELKKKKPRDVQVELPPFPEDKDILLLFVVSHLDTLQGIYGTLPLPVDIQEGKYGHEEWASFIGARVQQDASATITPILLEFAHSSRDVATFNRRVRLDLAATAQVRAARCARVFAELRTRLVVPKLPEWPALKEFAVKETDSSDKPCLDPSIYASNYALDHAAVQEMKKPRAVPVCPLRNTDKWVAHVLQYVLDHDLAVAHAIPDLAASIESLHPDDGILLSPRQIYAYSACCMQLVLLSPGKR